MIAIDFISVLETGDVASLHYIQTFFFHIRCLNSNKNPSSTDTIHHTTFFPNLQIPTPPSDTNARYIKLKPVSEHQRPGMCKYQVEIDPGIEGCDSRVSGPDFIYPSRTVMNTYNSTLCGYLKSRFDVKFPTPKSLKWRNP